MSTPLVWLPFDPAELGEPPDGLRYEEVDPTEHVPDSVSEVEIYVPPYSVGPGVARGDPADDLAALRPDAHRGRRQHPWARSPMA